MALLHNCCDLYGFILIIFASEIEYISSFLQRPQQRESLDHNLPAHIADYASSGSSMGSSIPSKIAFIWGSIESELEKVREIKRKKEGGRWREKERAREKRDIYREIERRFC